MKRLSPAYLIEKLAIVLSCIVITGCVANRAYTGDTNQKIHTYGKSGVNKPVIYHHITFQSGTRRSAEDEARIAERTQFDFAKYIARSECCILTRNKEVADVYIESMIAEEPRDTWDYLALGISGLTMAVIPSKTRTKYTYSVKALHGEEVIYQNRFIDYIDTYIWIPLYLVELGKPFSEYRPIENVLNGFQYRLVNSLMNSGILHNRTSTAKVDSSRSLYK